MKHRRITTKLEQKVLHWLRAEALLGNTTVSALVQKFIAEQTQSPDYEAAMRRALARKPFLNAGGPYLSREKMHER